MELTVFYKKPDYFLTGGAHFSTDHMKSMVNVITARDCLARLG